MVVQYQSLVFLSCDDRAGGKLLRQDKRCRHLSSRCCGYLPPRPAGLLNSALVWHMATNQGAYLICCKRGQFALEVLAASTFLKWGRGEGKKPHPGFSPGDKLGLCCLLPIACLNLEVLWMF